MLVSNFYLTNFDVVDTILTTCHLSLSDFLRLGTANKQEIAREEDEAEEEIAVPTSVRYIWRSPYSPT